MQVSWVLPQWHLLKCSRVANWLERRDLIHACQWRLYQMFSYFFGYRLFTGLQVKPILSATHICLTSFPNTCFLNFLVMSFAVQLTLHYVSTPYVLGETATWSQTNSPTCVMLMISKMSSMFLSTASITTWFLSAGNMHVCFPNQERTTIFFFSQNSNKIAFYWAG